MQQLHFLTNLYHPRRIDWCKTVLRGISMTDFLSYLRRPPVAAARMHGSDNAIVGMVKFYKTPYGTLVSAHIHGLPSSNGIYAFHIHSGSSCTGNAEDPFANTGTHYNPGKQPHPYHAGDLPPLFSSNGRAFTVVLTDRFTPAEVIGRTVIIHAAPDDFTTQPSGNAGKKIACGEIKEYDRRTGY